MRKRIDDFLNNSYIIKSLFIISCILFVLPSLIYLFNNKTIYGFDKWFCFFMNDSNRNFQTMIYILILTIMTVLYFIIIKKNNEFFKGIKDILIYVLIASCVFIFSINFTSSDVFYYLGIGRLDSKYGQNPYYTTIKEYVDSNSVDESDTVLMQGYLNDWADTTVVYGSIWTLICNSSDLPSEIQTHCQALRCL